MMRQRQLNKVLRLRRPLNKLLPELNKLRLKKMLLEKLWVATGQGQSTQDLSVLNGTQYSDGIVD